MEVLVDDRRRARRLEADSDVLAVDAGRKRPRRHTVMVIHSDQGHSGTRHATKDKGHGDSGHGDSGHGDSIQGAAIPRRQKRT